MAKDSLARGAKSASFGSMSHISQSKWDAMFESETPSTDKAPVQEQTETPSTPEKQ
jgi:hypothetical protein